MKKSIGIYDFLVIEIILISCANAAVVAEREQLHQGKRIQWVENVGVRLYDPRGEGLQEWEKGKDFDLEHDSKDEGSVYTFKEKKRIRARSNVISDLEQFELEFKKSFQDVQLYLLSPKRSTAQLAMKISHKNKCLGAYKKAYRMVYPSEIDFHQKNEWCYFNIPKDYIEQLQFDIKKEMDQLKVKHSKYDQLMILIDDPLLPPREADDMCIQANDYAIEIQDMERICELRQNILKTLCDENARYALESMEEGWLKLEEQDN